MINKNSLYERKIKRYLDFIIALTSIIVLAPVMLVVAVLVRKKLGKPIIFTQERPGLNEKIFKMYKFRSMTDKIDKSGKILSESERLTSFGKLIRSTSLDELPELFNILKGDMSFVGPRPLVVSYLPYYNDTERHRHDVRPGLTGWAQANGRNSINWDKKFEYDVYYVNNLSFWMDLKVIIKTIKCVLFRSDIGTPGEGNLIDFNIYRQQQLQQKSNEQ